MTTVLLLPLSCTSNDERCISRDAALCSLFTQDDGAIRVWKNFADLEKNPEMVTAWQGLSDMLPTTRGASPATLVGVGDKNHLRCWVFSGDGESKRGFSTSAIGSILVQQSLPSGMAFSQLLRRNCFSISHWKIKPTKPKPSTATSHTLKNNQSCLLLGSRRVQSPCPLQASQQLVCSSIQLNYDPKERAVEQWWTGHCPALLAMAGHYSPSGGTVAHVLPLSF